MGFYTRWVVPRLTNWSCGMPAVERQRRRLVPEAAGRVLEIGIGSGLNLPFYDPERVSAVIGVDPSPEMHALARERAARAPVAVEWLESDGEAVALEAESIDTILVTYSLCTIDDPVAALTAARRALRPGGRLLFCEHGAAADAGVRRWQTRLTPFWRHLAGGCRLDSDIPALIESAGFRIQALETAYLPKTPRVLGFTYRGAALAA